MMINKENSNISQDLKNPRKYKRLYKIGSNNIFLIISENITGYNKDKKNKTYKKLQKQINDIPNFIQTKIDFEIVEVKQIKNFIFAIGRYKTSNQLDDQCRKIIRSLRNLYFKQKQDRNLKPRNPFTISTQCSFY